MVAPQTGYSARAALRPLPLSIRHQSFACAVGREPQIPVIQDQVHMASEHTNPPFFTAAKRPLSFATAGLR